jgi:hypothetical protein
MLGSTRKPNDRFRKTRARLGAALETLETRVLLSSGPIARAKYYTHIGFFPPRTVSHFSVPQRLALPVGDGPRVLASLDNDGRNISGKDREGDEYFITVHGPGAVIVTDATPNDGALDDDIDTIRIVGSHPKKTYVTAQTVASARVITDGTVKFNRLIAENGVKSIILNGFNLTTTVIAPYEDQPLNVGPEIYLPGGVHQLQFNNVIANIDPAANDQAFEIVIGNPNAPLKQRPEIKIGNIFNTVVDTGITPIPNGDPKTDPTVNILVNGTVGKFEAVSISKRPVADAGQQYNEPTVSTTGRTALRAMSAGKIKVTGAARNTVISRAGVPMQPQTGEPGVPTPVAATTVPFQSAKSGLKRVRRAEFGGPTDALGIDVEGSIGTLKFRRGLGDPTGVNTLPTSLGYSEAQAGYPSFGFLGGLVRARSIGKLGAGPNNLVLQTSMDPDLMQTGRKGTTRYFARPGNALTSAAITTQGSIGDAHIVGDSVSSQIAAGFDYESYIAGLEPTRSPSRIGRFKQRGSLVDSVVSASYTPGPDGIYDDAVGPNTDPSDDDVIGPGSIRGKLTGVRLFAGGKTALNYLGAGVYARRKQGDLPPPDRSIRRHGQVVRP